MTNVNMRYGIYPNLPENAEAWRLKSCFEFEKEIEKDVAKYSTDLCKMKKKNKYQRIACGILIGGSTILAASGISIGSTIVGIIVGAPIAGFGAIVGASSLLILKIGKKMMIKLY